MTTRSRGLDTLRSAAIVLVFTYHYESFVTHRPTFGAFGNVGWTGVDLFFVLSGYLIGNQLLAGITRGAQLHLPSFYARRALRTWPAFFVVLAAYFCFPALLGGTTPPPLWRFLTFTQNLGLHPGTAFSHAWSLCIEEQFYLVVPWMLVIGWGAGSMRRHPWWILGALMAVGIGSRIVLWNAYVAGGMHTTDFYYPWIYYFTLCRFDEFLPGLALATVKNRHPELWAKITRRGQLVLAIGALATVVMLFLANRYYHADGHGYGFFMTAFGYSLLAMAFAVLVLAALSPASSLYRLRVPGAYWIALWSYSTYLTHKAVFNIVSARLGSQDPTALTLLVATAASVITGAILYFAVEAPFMAWRDRLFPSLFQAPASSRRHPATAIPADE